MRNPATGEVMARVPLSTPEDVATAVKAARAAFPAWRSTPPVVRARYLFKFKALLEQHKEEIATLCTREHGKTLAESRNDLGRGIENVEHA
ncbi:aldehyde dehydrogenase family protein, partial [Archangium sp.]|uniref:aldehyde dehydrogenase family protein n=1 Tax=Archangium sp. TaxID=1872627 RepID=UPI002D597062